MNKFSTRNKALVCLLMMRLSNHVHGIVNYHHIIPFLRKPSVSKQKIPGGTGCTSLTLSCTAHSPLQLWPFQMPRPGTRSASQGRELPGPAARPRAGTSAARPPPSRTTSTTSRSLWSRWGQWQETLQLPSYICVTPSRLRSRPGWGPLSSWWWGPQTRLTGPCPWTPARPSKWPSVCGTQVRLRRQMHQSCVIICLLSRIKLSQTTISRKI